MAARVVARLLATIALGVGLAACAPVTPTASSRPPTVPPTVGPAGASVHAYFILGSLQDNPGLAPVERAVDPDEGGRVESDAMSLLLAGPNASELAGSPAFFTDIPTGTRLLDVSVAEEAATVDLSSEFDAPGEPGSVAGRLAQVVFTLTQFPGITTVAFEIEGKAPTSIGAEPVLVDRGYARDDFSDQLPAIFVDQPAWGAVVANPLRVRGTADVFEATFHVRLLAPDGRSLADGPVHATCGSGCRGTFDVTIPYAVAAPGPARLQVYDLSEVDGSPVELTEYPVT